MLFTIFNSENYPLIKISNALNNVKKSLATYFLHDGMHISYMIHRDRPRLMDRPRLRNRHRYRGHSYTDIQEEDGSADEPTSGNYDDVSGKGIEIFDETTCEPITEEIDIFEDTEVNTKTDSDLPNEYIPIETTAWNDKPFNSEGPVIGNDNTGVIDSIGTTASSSGNRIAALSTSAFILSFFVFFALMWKKISSIWN